MEIVDMSGETNFQPVRYTCFRLHTNVVFSVEVFGIHDTILINVVQTEGVGNLVATTLYVHIVVVNQCL